MTALQGRNEAAERLRAELLKVGQREFGWVPMSNGLDPEWDLVDEALAAERRATVERIRERVLAGAVIPAGIEDPYLAGIAEARNHLLAILDEEAAR